MRPSLVLRLWLLAACGVLVGAPERALAQSTVEPPRLLFSEAPAPAGAPVPDAAIACHDEGCVVAWRRAESADVPALTLASRIRRDGTVLDPIGRLLAPLGVDARDATSALGHVAVATDGQDFLVVWQEVPPVDPPAPAVRAARMRWSDGALVGDVIELDANAPTVSLDAAHDGTRYVVLMADAASSTVVRTIASDGALGEPRRLGVSCSALDVACQGSRCAVACGSRVVELDPEVVHEGVELGWHIVGVGWDGDALIATSGGGTWRVDATGTAAVLGEGTVRRGACVDRGELAALTQGSIHRWSLASGAPIDGTGLPHDARALDVTASAGRIMVVAATNEPAVPLRVLGMDRGESTTVVVDTPLDRALPRQQLARADADARGYVVGWSGTWEGGVVTLDPGLTLPSAPAPATVVDVALGARHVAVVVPGAVRFLARDTLAPIARAEGVSGSIQVAPWGERFLVWWRSDDDLRVRAMLFDPERAEREDAPFAAGAYGVVRGWRRNAIPRDGQLRIYDLAGHEVAALAGGEGALALDEQYVLEVRGTASPRHRVRTIQGGVVVADVPAQNERWIATSRGGAGWIVLHAPHHEHEVPRITSHDARTLELLSSVSLDGLEGERWVRVVCATRAHCAAFYTAWQLDDRVLSERVFVRELRWREDGEPCEDRGECAGGVCMAGRCTTAELDAGGPDAGASDAGAPDAGALDASRTETDAGTTRPPDATGCGCRAAARSSPSAWWALAALVLVGLARTRRRA